MWRQAVACFIGLSAAHMGFCLCASAAAPEKEDAARALAIVRAIVREPNLCFAGSTPLHELSKMPNAVSILLELDFSTDAQAREQVLCILSELAADVAPGDGRPKPWVAWIRAPDIIKHLVKALEDDNVEVRNTAGRLLAGRVMACSLRIHAAQVISAIEHKGNAYEYVLLGKTGCMEAKELLKRSRRLARASPEGQELALAMLGDVKLQKELARRFLAERDPDKKDILATQLSLVGSPVTATALAQELRSPLIGTFGSGGRQSFRVSVIRALSLVFPEERILWEPGRRPTSDEYYAAIERWAEETLRVKWDRPRPPFFYEEFMPSERQRGSKRKQRQRPFFHLAAASLGQPQGSPRSRRLGFRDIHRFLPCLFLCTTARRRGI